MGSFSLCKVTSLGEVKFLIENSCTEPKKIDIVDHSVHSGKVGFIHTCCKFWGQLNFFLTFLMLMQCFCWSILQSSLDVKKNSGKKAEGPFLKVTEKKCDLWSSLSLALYMM